MSNWTPHGNKAFVDQAIATLDMQFFKKEGGIAELLVASKDGPAFGNGPLLIFCSKIETSHKSNSTQRMILMWFFHTNRKQQWIVEKDTNGREMPMD